MRIFFAHPKSMPDDEISAWSASLGQMFVEAGYDKVEVVPGRDDFQKYGPAAGGFNGWTRDVATRRNAMDGTPYYEAYVSPYRTLGKATADILTRAIHEKRPVIFAEKDEDSGAIDMKKVNQVVVDDPENYINGWWLDT